MEIRQSRNDQHVTLALAGRFDFNVHREFKDVYMPLLAESSLTLIEIDLSKVDYLDSSALGMLLMLRERANAANKQVTLSKPNQTVTQILEIANFNKIFTISV